MAIRVLGLNCTLTPSPAASSTQKMLDLLLDDLRARGAECSSERVVDHDIKPGVKADQGHGDEWPALRSRLLDAHILVLATPIWMGQPSSVSKRVLERLDAFLGESDDAGRTPLFGKVAAVAVVGNEDGAHHVCAELYQALADVGFSIPAGSGAYWVGEAMGDVDFQDLPKVPDKVASTVKMLGSNAWHLAQLLQASPYPEP